MNVSNQLNFLQIVLSKLLKDRRVFSAKILLKHKILWHQNSYLALKLIKYGVLNFSNLKYLNVEMIESLLHVIFNLQIYFTKQC